jgi:hypothetical protein
MVVPAAWNVRCSTFQAPEFLFGAKNFLGSGAQARFAGRDIDLVRGRRKPTLIEAVLFLPKK